MQVAGRSQSVRNELNAKELVFIPSFAPNVQQKETGFPMPTPNSTIKVYNVAEPPYSAIGDGSATPPPTVTMRQA